MDSSKAVCMNGIKVWCGKCVRKKAKKFIKRKNAIKCPHRKIEAMTLEVCL